MLEGEQFADIPEHPRAVLAQRDCRIGLARLAPHVKFHVHVAKRRLAPPRNLQPVAVELPRRHHLLAPRHPVNHLDLDAGVADPIAEFGREIAGHFFARHEFLRGLEQRADDHPRAAGGQLAADRTDRVGAAAPRQFQFVEHACRTAGDHPQLAAEAPEAEQADAEFTMHALAVLGVEMPLHRVAQMGGDSEEVGVAILIWGDAAAIVDDLQINVALVPPAEDVDMRGASIDRVFGQFADRLERVGLRMRDDVDRVPLVADLERAGGRLRLGRGRAGHGRARHKRMGRLAFESAHPRPRQPGSQGPRSLTVPAGAFEQHLGHRRDSLTLVGTSRPLFPRLCACEAVSGRCGSVSTRPLGDRDSHIIEARHLTTAGADKVRMIPAVAMAIATSVSLRLEPPDMVSQIDPRHELRLGELGEIAVDRRPVEAAMVERCRHLRVRLRPRGIEHLLEHGQPGCSAPQPSPADEALQRIDRSGFGLAHPFILPCQYDYTTVAAARCSTIAAINAGRSAGLRLETKCRSTTTGESSQIAPALIRSSLMPGLPVTRTPR